MLSHHHASGPFVTRTFCLVGLAATIFVLGIRPVQADRDIERDPDTDRLTVSLSDEPTEQAATFYLSDWLQEPVTPDITFSPEVAAPLEATDLASNIFGDNTVARSLLSQTRRARTTAPGTDIVFGEEGGFRATSDAGSLLGKSPRARGIAVQRRTPIVSDPRIRGDRVGRLVASGSYWFPARQDLDTMLSKIDSRLISNMIVVKGPYSARYGPGFDFVDFQLLESPRFDGYNWQGSTSLEYLTNGAQWYGRQMVMGGDSDYGYRASYGHRTGSDYRTGRGTRLPSSYNSRDFDLALGYDLSDDSHLEFSYLRLDQTGVEFPGLVFDINALDTDAFAVTYTLENRPAFDLMTIEGWYNRTAFTGDTFRSGKNLQIPSLATVLAGGSAITNVDAYSSGCRLATSWGCADCSEFTLGADLIYLGQQLNDTDDPLGVAFGPNNFPIPRSHSKDVGLFMEHTQAAGDSLTVNLGGRIDFLATDARNLVAGVDFFDFAFTGANDLAEFKQAGLDQNFVLASAYATAAYEVNDCWTLTAGAGHGQRPPSLTELYATGSFIGSLQPGLTFLEGDPELKAEKRTQLDIGVQGDFASTRFAANAFHAWVKDFITYEDVVRNNVRNFFGQPGFAPGQDLQQIVFTNTDLATLAGVELSGEWDMADCLTSFAVLSYVGGRDHTRRETSRLADIRRAPFTPPFFTGSENRSIVDTEAEPLPGIPPLEARVGLRLHDPVVNPDWGLELEARIVDNQSRVASSLFEAPTAGFTVWNLRGFCRPYDDLTLIAGVENFTDRFYREHLDYRSGLGVFQPGVNFYFSSELTY